MINTPNRWNLFRNKEKKIEASPDFSGEVNIDGKNYKLQGWISEGPTQRYFSGTVRPLIDITAIDEDVPI